MGEADNYKAEEREVVHVIAHDMAGGLIKQMTLQEIEIDENESSFGLSFIDEERADSTSALHPNHSPNRDITAKQYIQDVYCRSSLKQTP